MTALSRNLCAFATALLLLAPAGVSAQIVSPTGKISTVDTGSTVTTGQGGTTIVTGAPSNNSIVAASQGPSVNYASITLNGVWTGTLEFEQSTDGGNSWGLLLCQINGASGLISSATGNGIFSCLTAGAGATNIRVRATAAMTGAASVLLKFLSSVSAVRSIGIFDNASGYSLHVNSDGSINVDGGSVTIGGFASNGSFGNLTATGSSSASTALPTGTSVRISNTGTTQVSCTFATGAATGARNNTQVAPNSSVSRVNGTYDHIACIDQGGADSTSNVVVLEGGSGLGNDSGGGGGGSGGGGLSVAYGGAIGSNGTPVGLKDPATGFLQPFQGDVTNGLWINCKTGCAGAGGGAVTIASTAVAPGAYAAGALGAGAGVDGWNITEGAKADAACGTSNGTCSLAALIKYLNAQGAAIASNTGDATPFGTLRIGFTSPQADTTGGFNGAAAAITCLDSFTTTVCQVATEATTLGKLMCNNPNAATVWLQAFDVASSGSVTLGTTAPVHTYPLAAGMSGFAAPIPDQFTSGLSIAGTTTPKGSTAPGSALSCDLSRK